MAEHMTPEEAYDAIRTIRNCLRRLPEGTIKSTALPLAERIFDEIEESRKQYEQRTEQNQQRQQTEPVKPIGTVEAPATAFDKPITVKADVVEGKDGQPEIGKVTIETKTEENK